MIYVIYAVVGAVLYYPGVAVVTLFPIAPDPLILCRYDCLLVIPVVVI